MEKDMTRGNITSIMLRFAIPLFLGNAFQTFYNMADSIIVGRFLGEEALAAVGSTGIIMFLLFSFSGGVVSGFTILTSQKYGAHDSDGVKRTVSNGCLLALLIGAGATVLGLAAIVPLLRFMNTPENIFADAQTYITIICAGTLASLFYRNNGLKAPAFKRGDERPYSLPTTQVLSSIEYMKSDIIVIDTYVGGAFHVCSTPFA